MNLHQTVARFFPRSLLVILASSLPLALACNYLSQLKDVHPAAGTMSPAAVAARLAPVVHVLETTGDVKVAAGYAAAPGGN